MAVNLPEGYALVETPEAKASTLPEGYKIISGGKPELSKEDYVKGMVANLVQGAAMGTGGTISGLSNIAATPAREIASEIGAAPELPEQSIGEQFESGRKAFEEPEQKFMEAHPVIATGAQLVGGLPTMAVTGGGKVLTESKPILAKMVKGMAEGAGYGAAYGAGSSLSTPAENILKGEDPETATKTAAVNALTGGAYGAVLGGGVPVVTSVGGFVGRLVKSMVAPKSAAMDVLRNMVSKDAKPMIFSPVTDTGMNKIGFQPNGAMASKEIPKFNEPIKGAGEVQGADVVNEKTVAPESPRVKMDLMKQAAETNTPLLELADPDGAIHRLAMETKLNGTDEARNILTKFSRQKMEEQPAKLVSAVNEVLGTKNHFQNLDEIQAAYKAKAAPLYEKAYEYGDLVSHDATIKEIAADPLMQKYIRESRSKAIGRGLKGLPDTDIRVLDAAKQKIDDAIGKAVRDGEKNEARALKGLKAELVEKMDVIAPEYKEARQVAGDHLKMIEAQEVGAKILRGETPESIARLMPTMSPAEQEALKIGFRDELLKQIGQGANTARSNVALKVFKETENSLARQNMKAILGKDYEPLIQKVDPLVRSGRNISDLMEGSQTEEKHSISARGLSVSHLVKKGIIRAVREQANQNSTDIARMLTDPAYLREMLGKYK